MENTHLGRRKDDLTSYSKDHHEQCQVTILIREAIRTLPFSEDDLTGDNFSKAQRGHYIS